MIRGDRPKPLISRSQRADLCKNLHAPSRGTYKAIGTTLRTIFDGLRERTVLSHLLL